MEKFKVPNASSIENEEQNDSAYQVILKNFKNYDGLKSVIIEKIAFAKDNNIKIGSDEFAKFVLEGREKGVNESNFEILEKIINGIAREVENLKNAGIIPEENTSKSSSEVKESITADTLSQAGEENNIFTDEKNTLNDYEHFINYGEYPDKDK